MSYEPNMNLIPEFLNIIKLYNLGKIKQIHTILGNGDINFHL